MGRYGLALLAAALVAGAARAQDKQEEDFFGTGAGGRVLTWDEGERKVTFATGGVILRRSGMELKAGRILVWRKKGGSGSEPIEEIYAEGNVVIEREKKKLHAEKLYLDMRDPAHPSGIMIDLRAESFSRQFNEPFYLSAQEARIVGQGKLVAHEISVSTCSYGVPHYHLSIEDGTLECEEQRTLNPGDPWGALFPCDSWRVQAEAVYPELMGAPLFFVPAVVFGPALQNFPLRHVEGGHSSTFGYYAYTRWGTKIVQEDPDGKERTWGDIDFKADYRENRGGGYGPELRYKWQGYEGYIDTYYLHDVGRDLNLGINEIYGPLVYHDRGKAHMFHRQDLDEHWRLELEAYYVSDRNLREEFFPKEFFEEKDPETAAYLRWSDGPMAAYFYERYKINDWQTVDEYLPKIDFSIFQVPVVHGALSDLYVTERFDAGRIRREFDHALKTPPADVWRIDSLTEVSLPWDLTYFQVSPFLMQRLTYYETTLDGDAELRSDAQAGGRISTQLHGTWPEVGWEGVGLRGLRHIMEFEVQYASTLHHTLSTNELYPFDAVDQLGEFTEIELGMHHRFKTKDETGKPFEFLSLGVEVEYYPNAQRDTTSLRVDDYLPPYNYIIVSPRTDGTFPARNWSNIHYGMTFQPRNFLQAYGAGEYNPVDAVEEVRQYGLTVWPWEKTSLSFGQVYVRGVTDAYGGTITTALTEKWGFSVQAQYDFKLQEFLMERLVVSRDYHDFLLEAVVENNASTKDRRIYVTFVPKFLGAKGEHRSHMAQPLMPPPQYTNPQP